MRFTRAQLYLGLFTLAYIAGFSVYFLSADNFEFIGYIGVLVFFFVLIAATLRRSGLPLSVLCGLSLWGLLHMAGGGIPIGDGVLYGLQIIPLYSDGGDFTLIKYDQLVHAFGFGVATLAAYHLLKPSIREAANWGLVYAVLVATGMGLGVLNELVEFTAVLLVPETGVGGYHNTLLDLVFNTVGACLAVVYIHAKEKRRALL